MLSVFLLFLNLEPFTLGRPNGRVRTWPFCAEWRVEISKRMGRSIRNAKKRLKLSKVDLELVPRWGRSSTLLTDANNVAMSAWIAEHDERGWRKSSTNEVLFRYLSVLCWTTVERSLCCTTPTTVENSKNRPSVAEW